MNAISVVSFLSFSLSSLSTVFIHPQRNNCHDQLEAGLKLEPPHPSLAAAYAISKTFDHADNAVITGGFGALKDSNGELVEKDGKNTEGKDLSWHMNFVILTNQPLESENIYMRFQNQNTLKFKIVDIEEVKKDSAGSPICSINVIVPGKVNFQSGRPIELSLDNEHFFSYIAYIVEDVLIDIVFSSCYP